MEVRVLLFGGLKELLARECDAVELPEQATVAQFLERFLMNAPEAGKFAGSLAVAVNREYARSNRVLRDGDEVALLPPVSGGADNPRPQETPLVRLQREPIDAEALLAELKQGEDGAIVVFEGIVRNHTRGRRTLYLDYEAYEEMALEQMHALVREAKQRFSVREIALIHRLGTLQIRETSVFIAAASPHRTQAFEACRWLIDTLKQTVPIWKKEYFEDGVVWANGEPFPPEIVVRAPGDGAVKDRPERADSVGEVSSLSDT